MLNCSSARLSCFIGGKENEKMSIKNQDIKEKINFCDFNFIWKPSISG
ncbi:hypothetical protein VCRA2120O333_90178 [Vibrio crassostreae]|nr:hypothetical protein VCRA2122O341_20391 [Vibrio crassostreae]CAK3640971.1 hypothetical protein VCRA2121O334_90173 [Vibrio crassostreae]CAK3875799.1 hypothetical protein VCRA2120E57_30110 [Vibrio crassostreae]CAK3996147.1 hypothetical protein VCRA2120O333_90178 [Vibrio crassostreae]